MEICCQQYLSLVWEDKSAVTQPTDAEIANCLGCMEHKCIKEIRVSLGTTTLQIQIFPRIGSTLS